MPQFLQQLPSAPMGQGFMVWALSKTVEIPLLRATSSIFWVASQQLTNFSSFLFFAILFTSVGDRFQLAAETHYKFY